MSIHRTREAVLDALGDYSVLEVLLGDGDTAWNPLDRYAAVLRPPSAARTLHGPGLVTYRRVGGILLASFDPLAGAHDPRCDAVSADGDVCRLLPGDHATHYWGEL